MDTRRIKANQGTPLFIAAKAGKSDAVEKLLEAKADTNTTANEKTLRDVTTA